MGSRRMKRGFYCMAAAVLLLLAFAGVASAAQPATVGNWWDVTPEVEVPSPFYDSILYSEIAPRLRQIEMTSNRVKVEVIGQSAGGRNLFLVTISDPQAQGRLGQYQAIRQAMIRDPEHAQELIDRFGDFKVPVFINGSIHGNEYPGTDAAMRLIEEFAFSNEPEVHGRPRERDPAHQRRARTRTVACWGRGPTPTASTSTATSSPSRSPRRGPRSRCTPSGTR